MDLDAVLARTEEMGTNAVCVTGGEPLAQNGTPRLIQALLDAGKFVVLETNGSLPIDELPCSDSLVTSMDVKCPSSGMEKRNLYDNIEVLGPGDQLKFVIEDEKDYGFAKRVLKKHKPVCNVIFTPVGGLELRWLAERALADRLDVRVLPQLHKLIWGNERAR